jgi:hypothetical protein
MPICCLHCRVCGGPGGQPRDLGAQLDRALFLAEPVGLPQLGVQAGEVQRAVHGQFLDSSR